MWWIQNLLLVNGQPLIGDHPSLQIETNAFRMGWGAVCARVEMGGWWTDHESTLNINCLELLAAFHVVRAFAKNKKDMVIQVHLDNTTAVAYINHLGGMKSHDLHSLAVNLWDWCLQRHLFVIASYIPGVDNTGADQLSRSDSIVDRHEATESSTCFRWSISFGIHYRWVYLPQQSPGREILQLEARSISQSGGYLQSGLEGIYRVRQFA